jgi:hypothetical protein
MTDLRCGELLSLRENISNEPASSGLEANQCAAGTDEAGYEGNMRICGWFRKFGAENLPNQHQVLRGAVL